MKFLNYKSIYILPVAIVLFLIFSSPVYADTVYLAPDGNDQNTGTEAQPKKSIQSALDTAKPGDVIFLLPGDYYQDVKTTKGGTKQNPITVSGNNSAVIHGAGNDRIFEVNHDYITLQGFTIDGKHGSTNKKDSYRDTLIYALGKQNRDGVDGLKILNMNIMNAGGECIRLRYFATGAEIRGNTIKNCGILDFVFNAGGKNGEGVYIGTSSNQWGDGKNPTNEPDITRDNVITDNYIETNGNECVDIKEGAINNTVSNNTCRGQKDPESGGFDSRGDNNIFIGNDVDGSLGAGIRLGGWEVDGIQYGKNNIVKDNVITNNKGGGVKFQVSPQGEVCGNSLSGNSIGVSSGTYASDFNPGTSCDGSTSSSNPPETPVTSSPPPSTSTGSTDNKNVSTPKLNINPSNLIASAKIISSSQNFSVGFEPSHLWDGCYEGDYYNSELCTTGSREHDSFWVEYDLGKNYSLASTRIFGDADGDWVSSLWTLKTKENSYDNYQTLINNHSINKNQWFTKTLSTSARYVRLEVVGNTALNHVQVREFELTGTEKTGNTTTTTSSGGGSSTSTTNNLQSSTNSSSNSSENTSNVFTSTQTLPSGSAKELLTYTELLKQGSRGTNVTLLQNALNSLGFPVGAIDGIFGLLTKNAVMSFQSDKKLKVDGIVGKATISALNDTFTATNPITMTSNNTTYSEGLIQSVLSFGSRGSDVEVLQDLLKITVDGIFGKNTLNAVQMFQQKNILKVDGIVGPETIKALWQHSN